MVRAGAFFCRLLEDVRTNYSCMIFEAVVQVAAGEDSLEVGPGPGRPATSLGV